MKDFNRLLAKTCERFKANENEIKVYTNSYCAAENCRILMIKVRNKKFLLVAGRGGLLEEMEGTGEDEFKICNLSHYNRLVLNKYFDYTIPRAFGKKITTFGLGDRLGLASAAHIKTLSGRNIKPVLAQQSKRELELTGRTYDDVLDAACFAVIQEGYKGGFGADGDHLKEERYIKEALDSGYSMITLDCSDKIDNSVEHSTYDTLLEKYSRLPANIKDYYEGKYLGKEYTLGGNTLCFDKETLIKNVLIYSEVINFIEEIHTKYIKSAGRDIDFEISLDETISPTTIYGHFMVANEISDRKINISSMAPRFVGEFQKGIDYIGDIIEFERNFKSHAQIADCFGYKLSIHSGSDKFSIYEIIGKHTGQRLHIKVSGTNWLEAVRVIAAKNPKLFRRMHKHALEVFDEAKRYYHVSADMSTIKDIDSVSDEELLEYFNDNNSRQLMHITYGFLLQAEKDGKRLFKDDIYEALDKYEETYELALVKHISRHADLLGIRKPDENFLYSQAASN